MDLTIILFAVFDNITTLSLFKAIKPASNVSSKTNKHHHQKYLSVYKLFHVPVKPSFCYWTVTRMQTTKRGNKHMYVFITHIQM